MYTNCNGGNTFDQYKISYNLLCIIIIFMQEVYITCPVFISTLMISVKRDLPCFAECCCGPGGVFHHACEGWSSAFWGALICNEDETADDHILTNNPFTSVGCTLAPEDLEDRPPTTAGIEDCRSKESMPTSVGVGSYAAIAYGKRWYVAKVTDVQDCVFGVSYTTSCRGKWKWGRTDEGRALRCWKPFPGQSRGERCGRPALQQHQCRPVD